MTFLIWLTPVILLVQGVFSGAEIALLSVDRLELRARSKRARGYQLALELSENPERVLSTTLLVTCLCVVTLSAVLESFLSDIFGHGSAWAAIAISSTLIIIFGELIPKALYQRFSLQAARWVAYPVSVVYYAAYPITRPISIYTGRLARLVVPIEELVSGVRRTTREELSQLLNLGKRDSELRPSERKMLRRVFSFSEADAGGALIPLVRVDAVEESRTLQEVLEVFDTHRHSRLPVYSGRIDNIVGVLDLFDALCAPDLRRTAKAAMRPAHYIAETQTLEDVLVEMHERQSEMVIVVDEHGGAVGALTLEDIMEEIVGEIQDEFDREGRLWQEISESAWSASSQVEIGRLNEDLKLELPEGEYKTLSGFLLQQFGRIPEQGAELYFDTSAGALKFTVLRSSQRRIEAVQIERTQKPESEL